MKQKQELSPRKDIWEIEKLLGLRRTNRGWEGTYTTGEFNALFDYDRGLLYVSICSPISDILGRFTVMLSISTIDDGVWQAFDPSNYSQEEADKRVDEVAKSFLEHMGVSFKLPSETELNKWLMPLKLWGEYTG